MNRNRMLVFAVVAIAFSAVVAFVAYRMLRNRLASAESSVQIVVAVEKLPLGTRITEEQVRLAPWPASAPLEGSFADPNQVVGRGVVVAMATNEPVLESKLAPAESGGGLTTIIPDGMRAVSVKVDDVTGVAGFVVPGTRVDVIAVGSPNDKSDEEVSKVFLENILVLAAGQNVERDAQGKPLNNVQVVTLLVTPEDAQKLALASTQKGRIRLALRNPLDRDQANPNAVSKSVIYGSSSTTSTPPEAKPVASRSVRRRPIRRTAVAPVIVTPAPAPVPAIIEMELIKGDKREKVTFERKQGPPNRGNP